MTETDDTERAFMGALLYDPAEVMPVALDAGVTEDWFADDPWAVVWLAAKAIWARGAIAEADAVAIYTEAKRIAKTDAGKKFSAARLETSLAVESAIEVASGRAPGLHIENLRRARMLRMWRRCQAEAARTIDAGGIENALLAVRSRIDEILGEENARRAISVPALLDRCVAQAEEAYKMRVDPNGPRDLNWTPGYKMPWPELTGMLGGLEPGLHVIAARPSVGKTSYGVNLLRFWCDMGYPVCVNSLDMSEEAIAWRFLAERARVSIRKSRFSPTLHDLSALREARDKCAAASTLTLCQIRDVDHFRSYCRIAQSAKRLGIVVVDYLGLMHSRNVNNGNEYERVSYVSDALKSLALDLGVPVVALAQLNREVAKSDTKRMPGLSDLRGSGSIEQDAYTVTLLHRDERVVNGTWRDSPPVQLMPKPASYRPGMPIYGMDALDSVWVIVCKAQNYGTGQLPFVVRKNYFTWSLADYSAKPILTQSGHGATAVTIADNTPLFARVHADWRHDPIEEVLEAQGALIRGIGYGGDGTAVSMSRPDSPAAPSASLSCGAASVPSPSCGRGFRAQPVQQSATFNFGAPPDDDDDDDECGDIDYSDSEPAF